MYNILDPLGINEYILKSAIQQIINPFNLESNPVRALMTPPVLSNTYIQSEKEKNQKAQTDSMLKNDPQSFFSW